MTDRTRPWLGRLAVVMLAGAALGSLVLAAAVVAPWQEVSPRWVGLVGSARAAGVLLALVGLAGAALWWIRPLRAGWRPLSAVALVPCVVAAVLVGPAVRGVVSPERPADGVELGVAVQNMWYQHADPGRAAREVLALDADVVVLIELTPRQLELIDRAGGAERFAHREVLPDEGGNGVGVLSRLPLESLGDPGLSTTGLFVEVEVGAEVVALVAAHPRAPKDRWGLERWSGDLERLTELSRSMDGHVVIAADLNATEGHRAFRRLLSAGALRDAHDVSGSGFVATWPGRRVPAFMRLDRILVSDGLGVRSAGRLPGLGSDQFGVEARITVPQS